MSAAKLPFNVVEEQKVGNLREESKNENNPAVGHQGHTPEGSVTHNLLRVVEVAVNTRVNQTNRLVVKEEITIEPSKITQNFIN